MWQWLSTANWFNILIFFLGVIVMIIAITGAVLLIFSRIKKVKLKFDRNEYQIGGDGDEPYARRLEARDYRHLLLEVFNDVIKGDISYRVRNSGWPKESAEWNEYVKNAVNQHKVDFDCYLDENYYDNSIINLKELKEWNILIWADAYAIFQSLYEKMLEISMESRRVIGEKEKELDSIQNNRKCAPRLKKCLNILEVIRLTREIDYEENLLMRERCMVETERTLKELRQIYYSHFLKKYRQNIQLKED